MPDVNDMDITRGVSRVHFAEPGHYTDSDRDKIDDNDFAGPHQSFPIVTPKDVADAAHLVGHADDPEAVKARIKAIAHRKGAAFVARLPKEWMEGESDDASERAILAAEVTRSAARAALTAPETGEALEASGWTETQARLFAPITRIDTERREVIVTATSEAVDSYNTRFAYEASKDAFARWAGNIREMHQPKAVGTRVAVLPDDEARKIRVRLRISRGAEDTWQKVLDGTLRGASIGASNVQWEVPESRAQGERPIPVARKYDLVELSLVDSASNPDSNGVQIVRVAGVDEQGVITPDAAILSPLDDLDSAADVADVAETPEAPAAAPVAEVVAETAPEAAAEPVVTEAPRSLTATPQASGWRPDREDYASFLARQRLEANQAGLSAVATRAAQAAQPTQSMQVGVAPSVTGTPTAGIVVTPVDPELMAAAPQQAPAAVYAPSRYPDHIRAAAAAAGEEAVARMPAYQAGVGGPYALYLQRMAQVRGAAEMGVYAEYRTAERAAERAAKAMASAPAAQAAGPMDSDGDHDGDEDEGNDKAPALSAKANATANKQVQAEANAEQEDADSIADDNSGVKQAQDEDEAPERAQMPEDVREGGSQGITTATGLQGYEMDGQGSASGKLNGSAMSGAAQRHRHSHGGEGAQIHTHDHEHTHPNGVTHAHPHAHGHAEAFSGGEHSHMHGHQHAFRDGQPTDTRLLAPVAHEVATGSQGANMPDEERAGLSQTGFKSNIQPTSNSGPKPAKSAGGLSSPVLSVSPQKVGALSVVDTEEPMARDGGVPEPADAEATPEDLTLNGEDFHEGGHAGYAGPEGTDGSALDIDGDHDEDADDGAQGEADTPIATDGALQHAAPSAIGSGRPTPKNSGSPARSAAEAEEQRIGARISGASRERLHKMRDNHRGSMLDVAELCGCPECKGHLMVLNGGMLDMGQDADHAGGADDAPDSDEDFVKIGQERMQRMMQRLVARAVNEAVRGLFAETLRMLTQSQAEHLSALTSEFADARTALETRMQDLELGLQDATSNLASSVEAVETRFATLDASAGTVAPDTAILSQLETRMGDVSRAVSESQQQITERMNAIAEVASELQASVARIESQPAPTQPLPGSGAAVKGLPYQNTEALRGLGVAPSGTPSAAELIAQLTALAQHPDIRSNVKSQTAIAERIMQIQAAGGR